MLDESGEIVAQADYVPLWDARRPTTTWDDPDEIMLGREFTLGLPADLPAGEYQLVSGLYDPVSGQRLLAPDGADYLVLAEISVRRATLHSIACAQLPGDGRVARRESPYN